MLIIKLYRQILLNLGVLYLVEYFKNSIYHCWLIFQEMFCITNKTYILQNWNKVLGTLMDVIIRVPRNKFCYIILVFLLFYSLKWLLQCVKKNALRYMRIYYICRLVWNVRKRSKELNLGNLKQDIYMLIVLGKYKEWKGINLLHFLTFQTNW